MEHDQNQWTKPPECNPGAEPQQTPEQAVAFRILTSGKEFRNLVIRLAPDGEDKRIALLQIEEALKLLTEACEKK